MAWIQAVGTFMRSGTVISLVGGLFTTSGYVLYKDYSRYERMMEVYSSGNILAPLAENPFEIAYIQRASVEQTLASALNTKFCNEFYLVNGEVGCGKSRTILEMVRKMMDITGAKGEGAPVYVQVSQGTSFPETLASAVHFYFDEHISHKFLMDYVMRVSSFPRQDSESRLTRVLHAIEESSFRYMQKTGRPVVLIIDGINGLPSSMPQALEKLMEKAKLWADSNTVKLVFVNNDEDTVNLMQKNFSCWSRSAEPIVVSDLSRKEALSFLMSGVYMESVDGVNRDVTCSQMHHELASKIVDVVGGRIIHLITFKRNFVDGVAFSDTLRHLKNHEQEKFVNVSRKPSQWKVVAELRDAPNKVLSLTKLIKATTEEDVHALLRMKVIRCERSGAGALVKFFSPLTEHVVGEMQKRYESQIQLRQQKETLIPITDPVKTSAFPLDLAVKAFSSVVLFALCLVVSPGK